MRAKNRLGLLLTIPLLAVTFLSCEEVVTAVDPAAVELEPERETFAVGELRQFTARVVDAAGHELRGRTVAWSISDPAIAAVDDQGRVTGLAPGEARVLAQVEGVGDEATVVIMAKPVETVEVQPPTATIPHDGSLQLQVTLRAADGSVVTDRPITFASENAAVATVDGAGLVSAAGEGTTRITATSEGKVGASTVTVGPEPVARVDVVPAAPSIFVGEVVALSATLTDAGGTVLTGRAVSWQTSDAAIATVDASGGVTGVGAGSATITATSEGVIGSTTVTVSAQPVAKVTLSPATTSLLVGQTATLTVTLEAADGTLITGRAVAWTSESPAVATVVPAAAGATATVTAVAAGSTTITAVVEGVSGTATVGVAEAVASVAITPPSANLAPGAGQTFQAELRSATGAVLSGRSVAWTTSDPAVFALAATTGESVSGTASAAGSATITATAEGVSGTAGVTVAQNVGSIAVAPNPPPDLYPGQGADLTATVRASDGTVLTDRPVTWTADPAALSISTSGSMNDQAHVTAQTPACSGESCTSTVTAAADGVSTQVLVRVLKPVATIGVSPSAPTVDAGATVALTATVRAADGTVLTGRALSWSSLTPALASVDPATGVVTAAGAPSCAAGSETCAATIRAMAPNDPGTGGDDVTLDVTVAVRKRVASITVAPPTATVVQGGTQQFTATVLAADGTALSGPVSWSATAGVATVSPSAGGATTATGEAPGTATITASAQGVSGTAQLTVLPRVASVTIVPNAATLVPGAQQGFTAELRDANGGLITGRPISWTSSDAAVFPLSSSTGATVSGTAGTDGTAIVSATAEGLSGTANVTVLTPVASVTVVPGTADIVPGAVHTLTAELRDANNNLLTGRSVTWSSTATAVFALSTTSGASVSGTAGTDGTSTIIATSEGKVGTATVSVTTPVHSVTIVPGAVTLQPLGTQTFTAQLWDINGHPLTGRAIDWNTNSTLVFLLSQTSGPTVSGVAGIVGTATITATAENAIGTATVTVRLVPAPPPEPELAINGFPGGARLGRVASAVRLPERHRSGAGGPSS